MYSRDDPTWVIAAAVTVVTPPVAVRVIVGAAERATASVMVALMVTVSPDFTGRATDALYVDASREYVSATVGAVVSMAKLPPLVIVVPVLPAASLPETVTVALPSTYVLAFAATTVYA